MESQENLAVGICIGTSSCCIGAWNNGKIEILPNDQGNLSTNSYVAFTNDEYLVGDAARGQAARNQKNTIYDFMRLIGYKFSDPLIQKELKNWPFKVEADPADFPLYVIEYKGEIKKLSPLQITAMMFTRLKENASQYLKKPVTEAVITVPDYFNDLQRNSVKEATTIAGLNVLRVVDESFAAINVYNSFKKSAHTKTVFYLNFGGSSLNISIIHQKDENFELVYNLCDLEIGGRVFDNKLVRYLVEDVLEQHKEDILQNPRAIARLTVACERVKRILTLAPQAFCEIDSLIRDVDVNTVISRGRFEELCSPLFERYVELIEKALKEPGKSKESIDEVILVGGSARILRIKLLLSNIFGDKVLDESTIKPEEAVAYGATIIAGSLIDPNKKREV